MEYAGYVLFAYVCFKLGRIWEMETRSYDAFMTKAMDMGTPQEEVERLAEKMGLKFVKSK